MKKRTIYQPFNRAFAEFRTAIAAGVLMITLIFLSRWGFGQTTVFQDQFNRAVLTTGAPTTYTTTVAAGDGGALIMGSSFLVLTNDASAAGNVSGIVSLTGLTSSYSNPYNSSLSLSSNVGAVEWTFNAKFNRTTNPAPPAAGSYSMAIVLAGSAANLKTGNGYAVLYGNAGTPDPIRLVRYTGGITGTLVDICTSGALDIANVNNYASVRVLYNPTGNSWKLFVRDDGASAWADPTSGVTSQKGATGSDATYTSIPLGKFGFFWSYNTAANQTEQFDNFRVTTGNCFTAPAQPGAFTTSSTDVCQGQTGYTYTVPNDPAATSYSWSYTGGTGATINGSGNSVTVDFNGSATSGTLEVTANNACGTSIAKIIGITVHPAPSQPDPFTAFSTNVCPSLSGVAYAVPNDPSVTYNWNYTGTGVVINGTGNSVTLDFSGSATSGTLEVTANSISGCGTSVPRTIGITVEVPATISCIGDVSQGNDSPLCNAVITYGAPTVGGTSPTITYLFSGATAGSGSGDASGSTFNVGITTVILTASNTCASPSCAFDVEVTKTSPTAPTSITSNDLDNVICLGQSIAFTANGSTAGSAGGVIFWYEGGCGSGAPLGTGATLTLDGQGGNPPVPTAGSHTYYARVQDNCLENTTCASLSINVGPPANTITSVNAPASACSGDITLVTATSSGGAGISYSWVQGSGASTVLFSQNIGGPFVPGPVSTSSPQVYAQFGAPSGWSGYYVCAQAINSCGSTANLCQWVRGVVNGPGPITPSTQVVACPNDIKNYSCGASNGASVYIWTLNGSQAPITPNGGNNTSVQVTFPSNFVSGQLCVTAALACQGSSTSPATCININSIPSMPGSIIGLATICPGATNVSYSVPSVPGAAGYNWTVPANATITSGANTTAITVNFPTPYTGSASVCVATANTCGGTSGARCKTVASGIPNVPAGITGPLTNVCNSIVQYSIVNPATTSYTWTNPSGTTIISGQGNSAIQLSVSPTFTSGYLTVVANSSLCPPASSAPKSSSTFVGEPNTPGVITQNPPGAFCSGDNLNFSVVNQVPGPVPVYAWTSSNGVITAGQGANNIAVTWGTNAPGTITVRASNSCGTSAGTRSHVFNTNNCREEGTNALSATAFAVYPNPAHDKVTVSIYVKEQAQFNVKLRDMSGRVILSEDHEGSAGLNAYDMDLTHLSKGVYMLEVSSAQHSWKEKVVVE